MCDGEKRVDDGPDKFMNCSKKKKRARVRVFDFGSALRPIQIQTDSANKKEKQESRNVREREEGGFYVSLSQLGRHVLVHMMSAKRKGQRPKTDNSNV